MVTIAYMCICVYTYNAIAIYICLYVEEPWFWLVSVKSLPKGNISTGIPMHQRWYSQHKQPCHSVMPGKPLPAVYKCRLKPIMVPNTHHISVVYLQFTIQRRVTIGLRREVHPSTKVLHIQHFQSRRIVADENQTDDRPFTVQLVQPAMLRPSRYIFEKYGIRKILGTKTIKDKFHMVTQRSARECNIGGHSHCVHHHRSSHWPSTQVLFFFPFCPHRREAFLISLTKITWIIL